MTAEQVAAALARIHDRHAQHDDQRREALTFDPAQVLDYLRQRGPHLPEGLRADDHFDAATLQVWLWWQHQERERWLFDTAARLGLASADFGDVFGLRSRQGVRDRRDRLHALLDDGGPGRPDEQAVRADRARAGPVVGEAAWLGAAREEILRLAGDAAAWYHRVDEDVAAEIAEIRRELRDGRYGPATWQLTKWAVAALASCQNPAEAAAAGRQLSARLQLLEAARAAAIAAAQTSVCSPAR